jgi:DNA invertase Pin-like site-specific DNA recombinase
MPKHIAIYVRVSTDDQKTASQLPDLETWAAAQNLPVRWFTDTFSGRSQSRPAWDELQKAIDAGKVATVCCWRLDRLGRSARNLVTLIDELHKRHINLVSLREGVDLSNPAGRMVANVLSAMAQFETEIRAERVKAGQQAAKARGVTWGGGRQGVRKLKTRERAASIQRLYEAGTPIRQIAKDLNISRPTIRSILREAATK